MKKRAILLLLSSIIFVFLLVQGVFADGKVNKKENVNYDFMIGTGFLSEFGKVMAEAKNGETIELTGNGSFSTKPKMINGNGTIIHRDADGRIIGRGVWHAMKLISFQPYGSGVLQGLPLDFEGGRALIKVHLMSDTGLEFEGILTVTCTLGKFRPSAMEGIRLSIRSARLNFNMEKGGATLFIRKD